MQISREPACPPERYDQAMQAPATALLALLASHQPDLEGTWRCSLACPGGGIPFEMEIGEGGQGRPVAWLINGPERRSAPRLEEFTPPGGAAGYRLYIEPYDSRLEFTLVDGELEGEWIRERGDEPPTRLPLHGVRGSAGQRFDLPGRPAPAIEGRWRVKFSAADEEAVGIFQVDESGRVGGTFLTTLGDYRWLDGNTDGRRLRLSVFDGAHAFLIAAMLREDGTLAGDFWSRDSWHETWTAVKDPQATLPDPFGLTRWKEHFPLGRLAFPDLEGHLRRLDDPAFAGKARLIVLFGSWCPNCYDESHYLVELQRRYGARGLSILGLAFELGTDPLHQTRVLRTYIRHHGIEYPILRAGTSDKRAAGEAFPLLDRVRAFPTTLFLDGKNRILAVHTGFSGPATGEAHARLRERFEALIEGALADEE